MHLNIQRFPMQFHFLANTFLIPRIEFCNFSLTRATNMIRFENAVSGFGACYTDRQRNLFVQTSPRLLHSSLSVCWWLVERRLRLVELVGGESPAGGELTGIHG